MTGNSAVYDHVRSVAEALGHADRAAPPDHGECVHRLVSQLPPALWHKVRSAVTAKYHHLESRYGRRMAVAIVCAGIVGTAVPLPGTSVVAAAPLIGLAELHLRLATAGDPLTGLAAEVHAAESEARELGERWVQDLTLLLGELT